MKRSYWLDLFTGTTWEEFLEAGGNVSGFRESRWKTVSKIKPGDYFLCYVTGISRWIGILEVTGAPYKDNKPMWTNEVFPCRLPVKVVTKLDPKSAVPVKELRDNLSYFQNLSHPNGWSGHFRGSPTKEKPEDAEVIIAAIEEAARNPKHIEFDRKLGERQPKIYKAKDGMVTVPDTDAEAEVSSGKETPPGDIITHLEMQWLLASLGNDMKYNIWIARNDRNKSFQGRSFSEIPGLLDSLPLQFDAATNRTIELIDVLWLEESAIKAAFEIEHTTSVYSGLLRMSDLLAMQPNINIPLYIVAPDDRREKVISEINRPTFSRMKPPLNEYCQYIPYPALKTRIESMGKLTRHLKLSFLDEIAESCD